MAGIAGLLRVMAVFVNLGPSTAVSRDPFDESMWGEYARLLLLATAAGSAAYWALQIVADPTSLWLVVGNILVMAAVATRRFAGLIRLGMIAVVAVVVVATRDNAASWSAPVPFFSSGALLACLVVLALRDLIIAIGSWEKTSLRTTIGVLALVAIALYMIVIPGVMSFFEQFEERPTSIKIEELTVYQELRIRSVKLAVFAIFTYAGACWGSFINVLAHSLPRGQRIALRSSACPQCGTTIRRIDNLPIFSYLNLGGKCRDCDAAIPIRYLTIEFVGAGIFGSLFLYELVTGATNVPGFPSPFYAGILWIILYTKWPVVGIYFYHAALMCLLLTLALMDDDRNRCPKRFAWGALLVLALLPIAIPTMLPIRFDEHLPIQIGVSLPPVASRLIAGVLGAIAGYGLGAIGRRLPTFKRTDNLTLGCLLIGVALGWQAVVTIGIGFVVVSLLAVRVSPSRRMVRRVGATAVLLLVLSIHHPLWDWIDRLW